MIRVNLLSSATGGGGIGTGFVSKEVSGEGNEVQRQGLVRLVIILLFPGALYAYEFIHIPELQARLGSKQSVLQDLQSKNEQAKTAVAEIQKFNEEKNRLQKQIDTLDSLRRDRQKEVKILDSIQKDIPEKVWLTSVEMKEDQMVLGGMATADPELTSFMETLSKSVFYKNVNLVRSQEVQSDKGVLKSFEVSCAIDRDLGGAAAGAPTATPGSTQ
jgi:type IV pilus assembly protein PilN